MLSFNLCCVFVMSILLGLASCHREENDNAKSSISSNMASVLHDTNCRYQWTFSCGKIHCHVQWHRQTNKHTFFSLCTWCKNRRRPQKIANVPLVKKSPCEPQLNYSRQWLAWSISLSESSQSKLPIPIDVTWQQVSFVRITFVTWISQWVIWWLTNRL